jgi:UPF0755 protein
MSETRQRRTAWLLPIVLGLFLCVLLAALAAAVIYLPQQAQKTFGAPDRSLRWHQRLLYAAQLYYYEDELTESAAYGDQPAEFVIDSGEMASGVAAKLESQGLIPSAHPFELYLTWSGLDRTIQAGEYRLDPGLNAMQIAQDLQDATPHEVPFNILAGWRVEEIAAALPTSGLEFTPEEFLALVKDPSEAWLDLPPGWQADDSLEGLFLPGQYVTARDTSLERFVSGILKQFEAKAPDSLAEDFAAHGLTFREAVILASVVEKEAVVADEQPLIASVFFNRLQAGMRLESDPTAQYALGYDEKSGSWWKNPLSLRDLEIDSPYNTYMYAGLPPGPICSPGLSAIQAVAQPAESDYLYFRAACDGSGRHNFAYTFEEHVQNACE